MAETALQHRARLDDELLVLARQYPREAWPSDPRLGQLAQFWLQRHAMFRRLDEMIREGSEAALAGRTEAAPFKPWLSRHLSFVLGQLDEHHRVEDHHYFPLFRRAEPKLSAGFELLERDHAIIDEAIADMAQRANRILILPAGTVPLFRSELGHFHEAFVAHGRLLMRHLDDEEDLVIPLLMDRGEAALLGS